jgi:hypothetical protein
LTSAPYFHNGSVPTLWHMLHVEKRPAVWRRTSSDGYDSHRVGLVAEELQQVPVAATTDNELRRESFQTKVPGKSAAGHAFVEELSEAEKQSGLE